MIVQFIHEAGQSDGQRVRGRDRLAGDWLLPARYAYWQSLPGFSHSSLLVKRQNNNLKANLT